MHEIIVIKYTCYVIGAFTIYFIVGAVLSKILIFLRK
jgi:hypothetical protein